MGLSPNIFTQPALQSGLGGNQVGVLAGFLGGSDFGPPFNGGNIASGSSNDTPVIHAVGFNNFLMVEVHAGGTIAVAINTLDPITEAVLFTDTAGSAAAGTNRYNIFAPAGTRSGDPVFRFSLHLTASVSNVTGLTLRLYCSNR
jgi:hypothetical protein